LRFDETQRALNAQSNNKTGLLALIAIQARSLRRRVFFLKTEFMGMARGIT